MFIVRDLIDAGGLVNMPKRDGVTPLVFACNRGFLDVSSNPGNDLIQINSDPCSFIVIGRKLIRP